MRSWVVWLTYHKFQQISFFVVSSHGMDWVPNRWFIDCVTNAIFWESANGPATDRWHDIDSSSRCRRGGDPLRPHQRRQEKRPDRNSHRRTWTSGGNCHGEVSGRVVLFPSVSKFYIFSCLDEHELAQQEDWTLRQIFDHRVERPSCKVTKLAKELERMRMVSCMAS